MQPILYTLPIPHHSHNHKPICQSICNPRLTCQFIVNPRSIQQQHADQVPIFGQLTGKFFETKTCSPSFMYPISPVNPCQPNVNPVSTAENPLPIRQFTANLPMRRQSLTNPPIQRHTDHVPITKRPLRTSVNAIKMSIGTDWQPIDRHWHRPRQSPWPNTSTIQGQTPPANIHQRQPSKQDWHPLAVHRHALTPVTTIEGQLVDNRKTDKGTSVLRGPTEVSPRRTISRPKHRHAKPSLITNTSIPC